MAVLGIIQEGIRLDAAILTGAVRKCRLAEHREEARWNIARRIIEKCLLVPNSPRVDMRPEVGRRSYDNAVEVVREALRDPSTPRARHPSSR